MGCKEGISFDDVMAYCGSVGFLFFSLSRYLTKRWKKTTEYRPKGYMDVFALHCVYMHVKGQKYKHYEKPGRPHSCLSKIGRKINCERHVHHSNVYQFSSDETRSDRTNFVANIYVSKLEIIF